LQCVAVCCSVLQCVAVRCSVLQCDAVCCSVMQCDAVCCSALHLILTALGTFALSLSVIDTGPSHIIHTNQSRRTPFFLNTRAIWVVFQLHMSESRHTYERVMSHTTFSKYARILRYAMAQSQLNESIQLMSHHVTSPATSHMRESCHAPLFPNTHETCVNTREICIAPWPSHTWTIHITSHVTHMKETCHAPHVLKTREICVAPWPNRRWKLHMDSTSHLWDVMSHVWKSHVTYEWGMSHMDESRHI